MYIGSDATQSTRMNVYQQQADKIAREKQESAQTQGSSAAKGDSVNLSSDARLMAEASRVARETPDVRQEKIDALKAQVQNGTYEMDNRRIAEGLLKEDMGLFT